VSFKNLKKFKKSTIKYNIKNKTQGHGVVGPPPIGPKKSFLRDCQTTPIGNEGNSATSRYV
jgi:hypothetical protein